MYSYRIPPQISGFGNIKSSYGQFEPILLGLLLYSYQYSGFGNIKSSYGQFVFGIITVLRLFAKMSL